MRAAFNLFDPDGEGKITQAGLKNTLKTLGRDASDAELRSLIGGDVDGMFTARDGKIDFDTFCKIYNGDLKKGSEQVTDLQDAFKLLDPKGKGYIGNNELQLICRKLGENLDSDEVRREGGPCKASYARTARASSRARQTHFLPLLPSFSVLRRSQWMDRVRLRLTRW